MSKIHVMSERLRFLVIQKWHYFLFLVLEIQIYRGMSNRWPLQGGDAAGFVDSMSGNQGTFELNFTYRNTFALLRRYFGLSTAQIPQVNFELIEGDNSFFHIHPYIASYLFRILPSPFQNIQSLPLVVYSASFAIGITLLVKYLMQNPRNRYLVIFLVPCLISPVFVQMLIGQPYFDKLVFGPMIGIITTIYFDEFDHFRTRLRLCALISERTALMVGILTLLIIFQRFGLKIIYEKSYYPILFFVFLGPLWYQIWTRNISQNQDFDGVSLANMRNNLTEALIGTRQSALIVFLIGLLPFFLILARNRLFIGIGLVSIAPNILVTVGGAEFFGYQTHYHSLYLPVLMGLSIVTLVQAGKMRKQNKTLIAVSICLGFFSNFYYSNYVNQDLTLNGLFQNVSASSLDAFGVAPKEIMEAREEATRSLEKVLLATLSEKKATISAPEGYMPILTQIGFRAIDYFPIGVGRNHYIVVPRLKSDPTSIDVLLSGHFTPEKSEILSGLISDVLNSKYKLIRNINGPYGTFDIYMKNI